MTENTGAHDPWRIALLERLDTIKAVQEEMREEFREFRRDYVRREVWVQRNDTVDRALKQLEDDVEDLKTEARDRRPQWTAIASALVSVATLVIVVIQAVP